MKKRNFITNMLVIALVVFSSSGLMAQPGRMGPKGKNMPAMMQESRAPGSCNIPDLTDNQKEKIEALKTAHLKKMQVLKLDMQSLQTALKKLTIADKPDQSAIDAQVDKISALQNTMMKAGMKHRMAIRALLTDDQKVYFDMHGGPGMHKGMPGKAHGMNPDCPGK